MAKVRKVLTDLDAPYLQPLLLRMETQSKETLARFAVDYAEGTLLPLWRRAGHGEDLRPGRALEAARQWLEGTVKFPQVKEAILACHGAARACEDDAAAMAAARAVGHAASTIHAPRHAVGLALYGALAVAYAALGTDAPWKDIEACAAEECLRMAKALDAVAVEHEGNPARIRIARKRTRG